MQQIVLHLFRLVYLVYVSVACLYYIVMQGYRSVQVINVMLATHILVCQLHRLYDNVVLYYNCHIFITQKLQ